MQSLITKCTNLTNLTNRAKLSEQATSVRSNFFDSLLIAFAFYPVFQTFQIFFVVLIAQISAKTLLNCSKRFNNYKLPPKLYFLYDQKYKFALSLAKWTILYSLFTFFALIACHIIDIYDIFTQILTQTSADNFVEMSFQIIFDLLNITSRMHYNYIFAFFDITVYSQPLSNTAGFLIIPYLLCFTYILFRKRFIIGIIVIIAGFYTDPNVKLIDMNNVNVNLSANYFAIIIVLLTFLILFYEYNTITIDSKFAVNKKKSSHMIGVTISVILVAILAMSIACYFQYNTSNYYNLLHIAKLENVTNLSPIASYRKFFNQDRDKVLLKIENHTNHASQANSANHTNNEDQSNYENLQISLKFASFDEFDGDSLKNLQNYYPSTNAMLNVFDDFLNVKNAAITKISLVNYNYNLLPIPQFWYDDKLLSSVNNLRFIGKNSFHLNNSLFDNQLTDSYYTNNNISDSTYIVSNDVNSVNEFSLAATKESDVADTIIDYGDAKKLQDQSNINNNKYIKILERAPYFQAWLKLHEIDINTAKSYENVQSKVAIFQELLNDIHKYSHLSRSVLNPNSDNVKNQNSWLPFQGYDFVSTDLGHSIEKVDKQIFRGIVQNSGLCQSAKSGVIEKCGVAFGDEEHFAVAGFIIAKLLGLDVNVELGANVPDFNIVKGKDMNIWLTINDENNKKRRFDVTPRIDNAVLSIEENYDYITDIPYFSNINKQFENDSMIAPTDVTQIASDNSLQISETLENTVLATLFIIIKWLILLLFICLIVCVIPLLKLLRLRRMCMCILRKSRRNHSQYTKQQIAAVLHRSVIESYDEHRGYCLKYNTLRSESRETICAVLNDSEVKKLEKFTDIIDKICYKPNKAVLNSKSSNAHSSELTLKQLFDLHIQIRKSIWQSIVNNSQSNIAVRALNRFYALQNPKVLIRDLITIHRRVSRKIVVFLSKILNLFTIYNITNIIKFRSVNTVNRRANAKYKHKL